ncbi:hypothetical protein HOY82DRAFT_499372 [Tuber indicum]|nr:hypothetical protein HOY82DRAFT_499372 [Tuber indicum]
MAWVIPRLPYSHMPKFRPDPVVTSQKLGSLPTVYRICPESLLTAVVVLFISNSLSGTPFFLSFAANLIPRAKHCLFGLHSAEIGEWLLRAPTHEPALRA